MKVAILGAGAAAFALAVVLRRDGHEPFLWSPSGRGTSEIATGKPITATGVIEGDFAVSVGSTCAEVIDGAGAVIVALPAMGHRQVLDAAASHLRPGQTVIISAQTSFGALYLDKLLAARGMTLPIVAWNTTLLRSRQVGLSSCRIATLRKTVDLAVVPARLTEEGLATCVSLFGDRFNPRSDLLAVSLSNVNAQGHMALGLCNFTRMEMGEKWDQTECSTPSVKNLSGAIDAERMALAAAFGVTVRSQQEHSLQTHGSGGAAAAKVATYGPATIQTRYTLEDVPFGLLPTTLLARIAGSPAPLHEAGIRVFSALYGRDLGAENDLIGDMVSGSSDQFHALCRNGFPRYA